MWEDEALCRHYPDESWFPSDRNAEAVMAARRAKAICQQCPVWDQCLSYALQTHQGHGIWGGVNLERTDGAARRALARKLRLKVDPRKPRGQTPCGTAAGARAHNRRGERACDSCRRAAARAKQDRLARRIS